MVRAQSMEILNHSININWARRSSINSLQLANVAAIMANRGWYYTPHFVKSIGDQWPT